MIELTKIKAKVVVLIQDGEFTATVTVMVIREEKGYCLEVNRRVLGVSLARSRWLSLEFAM